MVFRKFKIGVVIRLALLAICLSLSVWVWINTPWIFTQFLLTMISAFVLVELFRFVTKTNRDLAKFIEAINYQDYSVNFSGYRLGNAFDELHDAFRKTLQLFRELKLEKEAHYHYLNLLVKQVKVGIISFDSVGVIQLYNEAAVEFLGVPNLKLWERYAEKVPNLYNAVEKQKGQGKTLVKIPGLNRELSVHVSRLKMSDSSFTILVFQDIGVEVENRELIAWNQLIRVLTHEIMNSITPIISLTDTLRGLSQDADDDIQLGLKTIQKRSQGLLHFVDDYRKLTSIPASTQKMVEAADMMNGLFELHKPQMEAAGIDFSLEMEQPGLKLFVDREQMEQVVVNLLSNAVHAVEEVKTPKITMRVQVDINNTQIMVEDNGRGIEPEALGEIFIPFYSTREGGAGIGLSLSKQIVHQHGGRIHVASQPFQSTQFRISLPLS